MSKRQGSTTTTKRPAKKPAVTQELSDKKDTPDDPVPHDISDFKNLNHDKSIDKINEDHSFRFNLPRMLSEQRPLLKIFPLNLEYTFDTNWGTLINCKASLFPDFNIVNVVLSHFLPHFWIKIPPKHHNTFYDSIEERYPVIELLNNYLLAMLQLHSRGKRKTWQKDTLQFIRTHNLKPIVKVERTKAKLYQNHVIEEVYDNVQEDPTYDFLDVSVVHPKLIKYISDLVLRQKNLIKTIDELKENGFVDDDQISEEMEQKGDENDEDYFDYDDVNETIGVDGREAIRERRHHLNDHADLLLPGKKLTDKELTKKTIKDYNKFIRTVGGLMEICNANVDFINRWLIDKKFKPSVWYNVDQYDLIYSDCIKWYKDPRLPQRSSSCDIEILVPHERFIPVDCKQEPSFERLIPDIKIVAFDTESVPLQGRFPSVERGCPLMTAGFTEINLKKPNDMKKTVLQLRTTDRWAPDVNLYSYSTEKALVHAMCAYIRDINPSLIVTHNGDGYDWDVFIKVLKKYKLFWQCSPWLTRSLTLTPYVRKSNIVHKGRKGVNMFLPGRINLDLLPRTLEEYKLNNNTLNALSQEFIKERKEQLPYWLLEREFERGPAGRARIGKYCLKDAILTMKLLIKLKFFLTFVVNSNNSSMSIQSCLDRSSGVRVIAKIQFVNGTFEVKRLTVTKVIIVDKKKKYKGADCLPPLKGFYFKSKIITKDFSAMYPSIMVAFNLCYSTKISKDMILKLGLKPENKAQGIVGDYWQRPKYEIQKINGKDTVVEIEDPNGPCFLTSAYKKGIMPMIQEEQKAQRNSVKGPQTAKAEEEKKALQVLISALSIIENKTKEIKAQIIQLQEDLDNKEFEIIYLDIIQLSIKIFMNSMYGKTGDPSSEVFDVDIAETVTLTGKALLMIVRIITKTEFGEEAGWWFVMLFIYGGK